MGVPRTAWGARARRDTREGRVVGHVLVAEGSLSRRPVPGVAPLAVAPEHQAKGVGSALMTQLIDRADDLEAPMLLLLGSDAYYPRFGFEPAAQLGIVYPPAGPTSTHFQARRLSRYDPSYRGTFAYCWELR